MPAKDLYHDVVLRALQTEGWVITHDPLTLSYGGRDVYVDVGAERMLIAAEKAAQKIAVEIKSFLDPSPMNDLEDAVGQYEIYRSVLQEVEPDRRLYLAVPQRVYEGLLTERFGQLILSTLHLQVIIFDPRHERIIRWIP